MSEGETVVLIFAVIACMVVGGLIFIFLSFNSAYGAAEMRETFRWWPAEGSPRPPSDVEQWGGP